MLFFQGEGRKRNDAYSGTVSAYSTYNGMKIDTRRYPPRLLLQEQRYRLERPLHSFRTLLHPRSYTPQKRNCGPSGHWQPSRLRWRGCKAGWSGFTYRKSCTLNLFPCSYLLSIHPDKLPLAKPAPCLRLSLLFLLVPSFLLSCFLPSFLFSFHVPFVPSYFVYLFPSCYLSCPCIAWIGDLWNSTNALACLSRNWPKSKAGVWLNRPRI